jgi:TaqI-like C-terminal specificity domain/N-6 DNA Methylase/Type I restriction enzyme R protein N terminus (HSDR_N)
VLDNLTPTEQTDFGSCRSNPIGVPGAMSTPEKVLGLVEVFDRNADDYQSARFNEAMLRQQFVNPLFKCLGWDMDNEQGYAEAYKDVIHEAAIKIGGATKAPDYSFRIGGTPKFYLEAKKPSVNVKDDPAPAFQLRRYAWSAKMPLSILTNFKEFAVYDCRVKPAQTDKASTARLLYLRCGEFADAWDAKIAGVFAREAVLKGSFDKFADSKKAKRGTAAVDAAFLDEIETWREELAKNLALRNPELSSRELNFAVQITIDRIIFLRMCEDRGIEPYGQLQKLQSETDVYEGLRGLYRKADERYNSGLFHFHKDKDREESADELTPRLKIDDKVLKSIFRGLYYPDSPYEFSVLPVEILGQVYEQFLGKVIRLTSGHQAKVEEKPEVKKAGGVYYTPSYIVDYIVQHTVGRLLEGKTPKEAAKLTILDPACGSGSFLLGAYRHLLEWHLKKYEEEGPAKHKKEVFQASGGVWRLTTGEKKRILLSNIYGVDIDPQAVEVTKLSLLLKVLEGESHETIDSHVKLFHERALPDLASNVKCGNSLIGPDFYEGRQTALFDEEERYRINVFDWHTEFPQIMKAGGFDAVIGNPPWGQKEVADQDGIKEYIWSRYSSTKGIYDLFRPFVEKGIELTRRGAFFGMVLPDIVLLKDYVETRKLLLERLSIQAIDWWGMAFADAVIDAATIVGAKAPPGDGHVVKTAVHDRETPLVQEIHQADFWSNPRFVFNLHLTPEKRQVLQELERFPRLGDFFEVHEGVHSGNIREELFVDSLLNESCRPLIFGRDEIRPYLLRWNGKFIRLDAVPQRKTKERYANAGNPEWYAMDKLLVRRTGDYVLAAVDRERRYASNNFFIVFPKRGCELLLDGLCALLNSPFMTWYFRTIEPRQGRVFAELKIKHLVTFPLPGVASQPGGYRALNELGKCRASLVSQQIEAAAPQEQGVLQRTIREVDARIQKTIQSLFELPDEVARMTGLKETEHAGADRTDDAPLSHP